MTPAPSDREHDFAKYRPGPKATKATLAAIERDSRAALERLAARTPLKPGELADIKRSAVEDLNCAALVMQAPPPAALVELLAKLVGVKSKQRAVRNPVMFQKAAAHLAANPNATASAIRRAIGGDFGTIKEWLANEEFRGLVRLYTAHKGAIPKFPPSGA
jgi:hypothetical protein